MIHPILGVRGRNLVVSIDDGQFVAVIKWMFVEADCIQDQASSPDINGLKVI